MPGIWKGLWCYNQRHLSFSHFFFFFFLLASHKQCFQIPWITAKVIVQKVQSEYFFFLNKNWDLTWLAIVTLSLFLTLYCLHQKLAYHFDHIKINAKLEKVRCLRPMWRFKIQESDTRKKPTTSHQLSSCNNQGVTIRHNHTGYMPIGKIELTLVPIKDHFSDICTFFLSVYH